jgi:WD40 repeat protein
MVFASIAAISIAAVGASISAGLAVRNQGRAEKAQGRAVAASDTARAARDTAQIRAGEAIAARDTAERRRVEAVASRDSANVQRRRAKEQTRRAVSRELGARVDQFLLDGRYDLALLAAVEATNSEHTYEARNALLTALQQSPTALLRDAGDGRHAAHTIALSSDGSRLAAAYDSLVSVWTRTGGKWSSHLLPGNLQGVDNLAISPDGKLVAVGSQSVSLYSASQPQVIRGPLEGDTGRVSELAFGRDGRTLVGLRQDGRLESWNVNTGRRRREPLKTQSGDAINLTGDTVAVAIGRGDKCELTLWDVSSGKQLATHEVPLKGSPIAVGPKGMTLVVADTDGTVILWDVARAREITRPLPASPEALQLDPEDSPPSRKRDVLAQFSPDGHRLAVGLNEGVFPTRGMITIWDVTRGSQIGAELRGHVGGVRSMAFSKDGQTLAASGGTVMLWNIGPRRQGTHVLAAMGEGGFSIAWSSEDRSLASGSDSGRVTLWNIESGQKQGELATGLKGWVLGVQYGAGNKTLRVGDGSGTTVAWNLERGRMIGGTAGVSGEIDTVRFSPDGRLAISTGARGTSIWDLGKGKQVLRLPPALTSSDGRTLLWNVGEEGQVVVWDVQANHRWRFTMPMEGTPLVAFDLSPDGRSLAIAGAGGGGKTWIWDLARGRLVGNALATTFGFFGTNLAFSPDGKTLASSGATGADSAGIYHDVISLWDVETHRRLGQPLEAGVGSVLHLVWSHDGRRLASTGVLWRAPGGVAVWEASVESWRELACRVAGRNLSLEEWQVAMPGLAYHRTCPGFPVMDYYTPKRPPVSDAGTP